MYGIFGREITKYTVIYSVYIRFWPTLLVSNCILGLKASEELQDSLHVRLHLHVTYVEIHFLFHLQAVEP